MADRVAEDPAGPPAGHLTRRTESRRARRRRWAEAPRRRGAPAGSMQRGPTCRPRPSKGREGCRRRCRGRADLGPRVCRQPEPLTPGQWSEPSPKRWGVRSPRTRSARGGAVRPAPGPARAEAGRGLAGRGFPLAPFSRCRLAMPHPSPRSWVRRCEQPSLIRVVVRPPAVRQGFTLHF